MDPAQSKTNQDNQNPQKSFCKQPITCPWTTNQPYPSTLNKNKACDSTAAKSMPNIPLSMESRTINEKTCPSLQHSSSQFFYFLRLMQLFPETHPATLHTVLCLCKNDFFCAVDKLLYAKRCKALYSRSQGMFKRSPITRSHPYCGYGAPKTSTPQEKERSETLINLNTKEFVDVHKGEGENNSEILEENNGVPLIITSIENKSQLPTTTTASPPPPSSTRSRSSVRNSGTNENEEVLTHVTSPCSVIKSQDSQEFCEEVRET